MKLIIINGHNKSGKNTFADFIAEYHDPTVWLSKIWSTQIPAIARVAGWDSQKDEKGRRLLSDIEDATNRYNGMSFNSICFQINKFSNVVEDIWITLMCRKPAEIKKFVEAYPGQATTVLIRSDRSKPANNRADQGVEDYLYDWIIENNGTIDEFKNKVYWVVKALENQ